MTSADYARAATITFDRWVNKVRNGDYTDSQLRATMHYKAGKALEAETHPKPPPAPPPDQSVHARQAKYVLFAAQEPHKALGAPAKYAIAFSADQAYRTPGLANTIKLYRDTGHRVCGWCDCRIQGGTPASVGVQFVHDYGLDYFIGQAESSDEFDNAMTVHAPVVVGNITSLRQDQIDRILAGETLFIQEDYWCEGWARAPAQPAISAYCAGTYPTALWRDPGPTIQNYKDAGRWQEGDGLYHIAAVVDWQNLP